MPIVRRQKTIAVTAASQTAQDTRLDALDASLADRVDKVPKANSWSKVV